MQNNRNERQFPRNNHIKWVEAQGIDELPGAETMRLTMAMGLHSRLGSASGLIVLGIEASLLRIICRLAARTYMPDLPFPRFIDETLYDYRKSRGFELDYAIRGDDHQGKEVFRINLGSDPEQYISILDKGPRDGLDDDESVNAADAAIDARLYYVDMQGDYHAFYKSNPGRIAVQFKSPRFDKCIQPMAEDDLSNNGDTQLVRLTDPMCFSHFFDDILLFKEHAYYLSPFVYTEKLEPLERFMRVLLHIATPLIRGPQEKQITFPVECLDFPIPRLFKGLVSNFIAQHGFGLDYVITGGSDCVLVVINLGKNDQSHDEYIMIIDAGPRMIYDDDVAAEDAASNAIMYGEEDQALTPFNPGNVHVQFKHGIFQEFVQGDRVFNEITKCQEHLSLTDPGSEKTFEVDFNVNEGFYNSIHVCIPESIDYLEELLTVLLRIATPVITEHWSNLPAVEQARLLDASAEDA
jgi:hypothetical protein